MIIKLHLKGLLARGKNRSGFFRLFRWLFRHEFNTVSGPLSFETSGKEIKVEAWGRGHDSESGF